MTQAKRGFQPGDRVRWRGSDLKGTVISVDKLDVEVDCDDRTTTIFHPELLIRLKPKPNPAVKVAREWWLGRNPHHGGWTLFNHNPQNSDEPSTEVVKVREVLEGFVQVTREQLIKAWYDNVNPVTRKISCLTHDEIMEGFMKALDLSSDKSPKVTA